MIYAALRIFGHGEIGPEIATISVTTPTTTSATITTGATSEWVNAEWSYVLVRGCTEIPDGRYPILSSTSTTVTIRVTGATAGSSGTGTVAIDDCYVFCNSIPPGVGTKTAARWFDCMIDGGLSADLGAQIKPTGGISDADGVDVSLTYWQDAPVTALLRQIPAAILDADGSTLRLSQSITSTTATSINVGIPDPINPQPLTVPSVITIDGEAMGYVANPSTGVLTVARGVLGTRATGHAIGVPVFLGMASPVGRGCTVTIYRDPEDASDRLTEVSGQITIPKAANGITQIDLPISTDLILPVRVTTSELGLTTCEYAGVIDGKHIVRIAQTDPLSVWSWVRFGDVAVRIRRAPAYDIEGGDLGSLGFSLIAYQLPNGLNRYSTIPATPKISQEDATRLDGYPDFRHILIMRDTVGSKVAEVDSERSWWTYAGGAWRWDDRAGLYDKFPPRPFHVIESPGSHALYILDTFFLPIETTFVQIIPTINALDAVLQVLTSTGGTATGAGGANGTYDLLPAELGMGIPLSRINASKLNRSELDRLDLLVLDPADKSIAEQITAQILEPAGIGLCQSSRGGFILSGVVSDFSGLTTLITDDSIYCEGENPPQVDGPEAAVGWLVSSYVVEAQRLDYAESNGPESRRKTYLETNGSGITAGGSLYGRTQGSTIKVETVTGVRRYPRGLINQQAVISTYGTLRQRLVIPVIGPAELLECGDVVGVSLTQVPGVNGQRGFSGAALVTDRKYDRQSGLISLGLLLFDGVPPFRSWAPGGDVAFVNDEADFTLSLVTHIPADDQKIDAFRVGDLVNIYDANYVLRSTNAPGVVATWNEATGDMTLSTAATDGSGDVLPVLGDIVVLAPVSVQTTVAADLFAYQNTSDTTTTGTRWQ